MTIEKLLGMSADQLDKLTSEELKEYFSKFSKITNPSEVEYKPKKQTDVDKVNAMLKQYGLNIKLK